MRPKFVSILILALCMLSIIVGLLNVKTQQKTVTPAPKSKHHQTAFLEKFSQVTNKIALISLQGPISSDESGSIWGDVNSAAGVLKAINKATKDKSVKGVILRINSPGGTVAMSQEIYNSILELRREKPVVVSMADLAASGGYFIACAADRIYANPGTLTGSVGVIMETMNASELLNNKLGVKSEVIKSGKFKDTGSIYRPLTADERTLLNNLVDNAYGQFLDAITEGRINRKDEYKIEKIELTQENLKKYADGRIFTGKQALEYGFVDELGGYVQAKKAVISMAKQKFSFLPDDVPVVDYNKPTGFSEFFLSLSSDLTPKVDVIESIIPLSRKHPRQPLYMWE